MMFLKMDLNLKEGGGGGMKGQKMVQNDEKLCLWCSIAQEPYIILLSFLVCKCKMIISPGVSFFIYIFLILIFQTFSGVKGQVMTQNDKKALSIAPYISGTIHHTIFIYGTYE